MVLFRFGIKILILSATILGVNFVSFVELCWYK
jgi:hypothetical protein